MATQRQRRWYYIIYKSYKIPVNCSKANYNYLMQCNKYSAIVWNNCIKIDKESVEKNDKYLTRSDLQFKMKRSVPYILANSINHVVFRYITARDAMFKSIKANHKNSNKVKLPYKEKKYYNTVWMNQNIKISKCKKYLYLAKPMGTKSDGKRYKQKPMKCRMKYVPDNIVEVELVYHNRLYLVIKTKEKNDNVLIQSNNQASIDLGEIHSITSIDNKQNAIIITGRKIREVKQLRNKHLAKLKRKRSKCTKGSNQYKKYSRAIYNLKIKTDRKILDIVHKTTKYYLDYCLQNNISKIYYGDLDNCTRNTKKEQSSNTKVRQKLSQWNYGLLVRELKNKLTRHGIKLEKVKEYYTSKKCPDCGLINNPKGRDYICECGYSQHRDILGAINILNDNSNYKITRYDNFKYLQIT